MLSVLNRLCVIAVLLMLGQFSFAKSLTILVVGQSVSSNFNEHKYAPVNRIYQISKSGQKIAAADPFEWADGTAGAIWIPFGQRLLRKNIYDEVTFMPVGIGGTSVKEWLPKARGGVKLKSALDLIIKNKIQIDYVFWFQGSSDMGGNPYDYKNDLVQVIKSVNRVLGRVPWVIARHSRCGNIDPNIAAAQTALVETTPSFLFLGPDVNSLGDEYRQADHCHLNYRGQEAIATLWYDAFLKAVNHKKMVERETLIEWFR